MKNLLLAFVLLGLCCAEAFTQSPVFVFVPDAATQAGFINTVQNASNTMPDVDDHIEVEFDRSRPRIRVSENVGDGDDACLNQKRLLRKVHPHVGDYMVFRVAGYHPYRDSVAFGVQFHDRNREDAAKFVDMLKTSKGSPPASPPSAEQKAILDELKAKPDSDKHLTINTFRDEMRQFYQQQRAAAAPDPRFLRLCADHIQANVSEIFGGTSSNHIRAIGNQWIGAAPANANKTQLTVELEEGIRYYEHIVNFLDSPAWLFQVKNADVTEVSLTWFRDGKAQQPDTYEFFNKGGFKIDFSTGVLGTGLVSHEFKTVPNTTLDSNNNPIDYRIHKKDGSKFNLGIALLAHAYYRWPCASRVKIGFTSGFLTDSKGGVLGFNYLVGGSFMFGSEQRLVLNTGFIFGKVARLAEGLAENEPYALPIPASVPTEEVFRHSWFLGVSYNFGTVAP